VARFIITVVLAAVVIGLIWPVLVRLRRGRVPDDVPPRRQRRSYFAPIAAWVVLTVLCAALWWLGYDALMTHGGWLPTMGAVFWVRSGVLRHDLGYELACSVPIIISGVTLRRFARGPTGPEGAKQR
jgi:Protein of unknown function (DUF2905)